MNDEILYIIMVILIVIIIYKLTDKNVPKYDNNKYFRKFSNKILSKLKLNNKLETPIEKDNKILIITYDDRKLPYIKMHNENLKTYSKKWNFEYKFLNKCEQNTYWCKIFLVLDELKKNTYDYVMWMDSDTYIFDMDISLSELFNMFSSDIFIGSDNNKNYDLTNAGVFAIKNSKIGKNFLNDCINSFNNKCSKPNGSLKGSWASVCYEQGIMNILIAEKYSKYTTILTNELIFNYNKCNNNVFIMHLYASSDNYRQKCFNSKKT